MLWMAGDDPVRMKEVERLPIMEYYFQLNKKVEDAKKAKDDAERQRKMNK